MNKALLRLSWPPTTLWPNESSGRSWRVKMADKTAYSHEADILALGQIGALRQIETNEITITFHKKDRRRYDLDNAHAAMKHALDAICKRWGRDDSVFDKVTLIRGEPVKGGAVLVEVSG